MTKNTHPPKVQRGVGESLSSCIASASRPRAREEALPAHFHQGLRALLQPVGRWRQRMGVFREAAARPRFVRRPRPPSTLDLQTHQARQITARHQCITRPCALLLLRRCLLPQHLRKGRDDPPRLRRWRADGPPPASLALFPNVSPICSLAVASSRVHGFAGALRARPPAQSSRAPSFCSPSARPNTIWALQARYFWRKQAIIPATGKSPEIRRMSPESTCSHAQAAAE